MECSVAGELAMLKTFPENGLCLRPGREALEPLADTFLAVALNEPEKDIMIRATSGHQLIAPEVLPYEIGNALTAMLKKGVLAPSEVGLAWDAVRQIPVELRAVDIREALRLAVRFQIYAYDAYFLDCALHGRFPLLTLDRGMKHCAQQLDVQTLEL